MGIMKRTTTRTLPLAIAMALAVPLDAKAAAIVWVNSGTGDWFDPSNWDLGRIPEPLGDGGAGDSATINNGGIATATTGAPPDVIARDVFVGAGVGTGAVSGTLISNGVRVEGQFRVDVGSASGAITSANGTATVTGRDLVSGQGVSVGTVFTPESAATAQGSLTVTGGGLVAPASLNVGQIGINTLAPVFSRDASATGSAEIEGDVIGGLNVGVNSSGSATSTAEGSLTVTNGDLETRFFGITVGSSSAGLSLDAGSAMGSVVLDSGSLSISTASSAVSLTVGSATGPGAVAQGSFDAAGLDLGSESFRDVRVGVSSRDGDATGSFSSATGDLRVREDFAVGFGRAGFDASTGAGTASGTADLGSGDIIGVDGLAGTFSVGHISNAGLFSTGAGDVEGEVEANGISGFSRYRIGVHEGTRHAADASAVGRLTLGAGGIGGNADGDASLLIGGSIGLPNNSQQFGPGGTAQGDVVVDGGNITGMASIQVGVSSGSAFGGVGAGMGTAHGSLEVVRGDVAARRLQVGAAEYRNASDTYAPDAAPVGNGVLTMADGTLALDGAGAFNGSLQIGYAQSFESEDPVTRPDGPNPVHADGRVELTDVDLTGNANAFVGRAFGFDQGPSSGTGVLNVLRGSVQLGSLGIGLSSGDEEVAHGTVTLTDTSLDVANGITVGGGYEAVAVLDAVDTDIATGGDLFVTASRSPIGTAAVPETRGTMRMRNGTLDVGGRMQVGAQFQGGEGELQLQDVQAVVAEDLRIGASSNLGSLFGNGVVELNESSLSIGQTAFVDSGALLFNGSQMSVGGDLITEFFNSSTGEYTDGASADSVISVTRSLIDIGGEFGHGINDVLSMSLDGTTRGTEYGAIDASTVNLRGGILDVDINFALTADEYLFDLVLSYDVDGILGDFGNVVLAGLDPRYAFTSGIVSDDFGMGLVEVYRLELTRQAVPIPAAAWLFASALGVLGYLGKRKSRT